MKIACAKPHGADGRVLGSDHQGVPLDVTASPNPLADARGHRLFIPVILGSIREKRCSFHPSRLLAERVAAAGHETELIDLRALALPMYDEADATEAHPSVMAFKAAIERSDASIWLSPEYNHSMTSALKNASSHSISLGSTFRARSHRSRSGAAAVVRVDLLSPTRSTIASDG